MSAGGDETWDRLTELELRVGQQQGDLRELRDEVAWLRRRLATLYPERSYCPKCRALVSSAARSCRGCHHRWGVEPDPKAGLPR